MKHPNVAGQFYPGSGTEITSMITGFLDNIPDKKETKKPWAIIAPHAGYIFSGQTAAHAYKLIQNQDYDTVVVLAPSHVISFDSIAVLNEDYQTPLGTIPVDKIAIAQILKSTKRIIDLPEAFNQEHSLEVQLPFLQVTLKDFKLIPLIIGTLSKENLVTLRDILLNLQKSRKLLIVASSDMAHFHDSATSDKMDKTAMEFIAKNDYAGLLKASENRNCELCGLGPVITLMLMAEQLKTKPEILDHSNSGKVTGDYTNVVGYISGVYYGI